MKTDPPGPLTEEPALIKTAPPEDNAPSAMVSPPKRETVPPDCPDPPAEPPVEITTLPVLPEEELPVPIYIVPLFPIEVEPELIAMRPLTPLEPPLAVWSNRDPLLVDVPEPVVMLTEPPVNCEVFPEDRTMLPPAPLFPEPTVT